MGQTMRVSLDSAGLQGNSFSYLPSISADGRFVAYQSYATNLVPGDTNGHSDIYVHHLQTGQTTRVSLDSGGLQGDGNSWNPSISFDGRFVAFWSEATNLVPGDTNGYSDIFVHDRQTGQTTRVSVDTGGLQGNGGARDPVISSNGRHVTFVSYADNLVPGDTNGADDVFVHDRQTGRTTRVSVDSAGLQGNWYSHSPAITFDGRYVTFTSYSSNLVPGDTNGSDDVFVRDCQTGQTTRVSVDSAGLEGNGISLDSAISSDGRFVAFESRSSNLVSGDVNDALDIFVYDRQMGETTLVSVNSGGRQGNKRSGNPSISADGRSVAFESRAFNLVPGDTNDFLDVFVHGRGHKDPSLTLTGTCPGPIQLAVQGASAHGKVALACGAAGNFTRAMPPCAGLFLCVMPPVRMAILDADLSGTAILHLSATAGLCGLSVQAVDGATCVATNVIVL